MKGKRCIGGGRAQVRPVLYPSSLSSIRCNPVRKASYTGLSKRNKPGKVAPTAVRRRLVIHVNTKLKVLAQTPPTENVDAIKNIQKNLAKQTPLPGFETESLWDSTEELPCVEFCCLRVSHDLSACRMGCET